jgi:hypothetical protein
MDSCLSYAQHGPSAGRAHLSKVIVCAGRRSYSARAAGRWPGEDPRYRRGARRSAGVRSTVATSVDVDRCGEAPGDASAEGPSPFCARATVCRLPGVAGPLLACPLPGTRPARAHGRGPTPGRRGDHSGDGKSGREGSFARLGAAGARRLGAAAGRGRRGAHGRAGPHGRLVVHGPAGAPGGLAAPRAGAAGRGASGRAPRSALAGALRPRGRPGRDQPRRLRARAVSRRPPSSARAAGRGTRSRTASRRCRRMRCSLLCPMPARAASRWGRRWCGRPPPTSTRTTRRPCAPGWQGSGRRPTRPSSAATPRRGIENATRAVAKSAEAGQLRHARPEQPAQPAVLGQQPLRDVGDRLTHDPGARNT